MRTSTRARNDAYTPNEKSLLIRPTEYVAPANRKAIIALHGHGADDLTWLPGWIAADHTQNLADKGYWVLSIEAGGGATWNNDAAMTAITAAYNYLIGLGLGGTKIGFMAWSMGGGNALQWIKQNPTKVCAAYLWAPATNLDYFYGGGNAELDTAYGGNYAVNSVGHKIYDEYATWRNKCPIKLAHGTSDTTVPPAHSSAFVAGVGQAQVTYLPLAGKQHTDLFSSVPVADTKAFFDAATW